MYSCFSILKGILHPKHQQKEVRVVVVPQQLLLLLFQNVGRHQCKKWLKVELNLLWDLHLVLIKFKMLIEMQFNTDLNLESIFMQENYVNYILEKELFQLLKHILILFVSVKLMILLNHAQSKRLFLVWLMEEMSFQMLI
jgi:hypothetical protein